MPHPGIHAVLDTRAAAIGARDIDGLMALYANDIVYFDLVPPLSYRGADALRARFLDWFGRWQSPIGQHHDHIEIAAGGDMATASMLFQATGTLATGDDVDYWVRTTNAFRRLDGT